jgi:ferredoxin
MSSTGCGICKAKCPQGAIKTRQTMPMRSDIKEYFREEFSLDLDLFD